LKSTTRFNIPARPDVEAFLEDARAILESGWLSGAQYVRRLEAAAAPWVGRDHVVAASNGTGALIAALTVLGEPGAEAIIPGYTFTATWGAVRWAGMVPVVADVDARGLLDPAAVAAAVTPRTRVIVPVPIAGQPAPMAELRGIADRAGARIVADAAHAFRSKPLATDPLATLMSRLASVASVSTGEARACPTRGASA
jgi:dTDP-4-amino-4,6-dideoxygalactose transaminase